MHQRIERYPAQMSPQVILGIAIGGACGAVARYAVSSLAGKLSDGFPWGTLTVNLLGCLAVGALLALATTPEDGPRWSTSPMLRAAILVGFVGSFTTFSTYLWEAFDYAERGMLLRAGLYLVTSNMLGLAAVWAGWKVFARAA